MKNIVLLLLASTLCFIGFGQGYGAPDNEKIKIATLNIDSPYFYPKLFERYTKGDTTLNLEDYRHLYYGYAFQDNYNPMQSNIYIDSLTMVLHENKSETIAPQYYKKILYYASRVLESRPFDINFINMMIYCYQKNDNIYMAERDAFKLQMIIETILSSGTGKDKSSPMHVLYREDAEYILGLMGATFYKKVHTSTKVVYYHLTQKVDGAKGYYFDISRIFLKKPELPKGKRKMEFNPMYNPKSERFLSPEQRY